jgi:hypothetical protein
MDMKYHPSHLQKTKKQHRYIYIYMYISIYTYKCYSFRGTPPAHVAREGSYAAVSFCCQGMRWEGGHRAERGRERRVGERKLLTTELHGCVRAFNGHRPPSCLEKGGQTADGTRCRLACCLTRCVLYQASDRTRTHLARLPRCLQWQKPSPGLCPYRVGFPD